MKSFPKRTLSFILSVLMAVALLAGCGKTDNTTTTPTPTEGDAQKPLKISLMYPENPTFPFDKNWPLIAEAQKRMNVEIDFEVIPYTDYATKTSLALNSGTASDVILYLDASQGEVASMGLNGTLVPINKYEHLTPNFNKVIEDWKLQADIDKLKLKDGNLYFMPSLYDAPFYDGGLIIRTDLLEKYNLEAPKTYDDLYKVLKAFKQGEPDSYPLTTLVEARVLYRMTMPSFGISLGKNSSSGAYVLSYDYDTGKYFAGATSDLYKEYLKYFAKLYNEGLLDPEMTNPGDQWTKKMATGFSSATYAYYDQIGGIVGSSKIDGVALNLLPPLEGPAGAHHQPKNRTNYGVVFPTATQKRADFEQIVSTIDKMFFSPEMAEMWCLGLEGMTYTMADGKVKFNDELVNSPDGLYKSMQIKYGAGTDMMQLVWKNAREMTKYDENYAQINKTVAAMDTAIQSIPPSPMFDDLQAEEAGLLKAPLGDSFEVWTDAFITGKKSIDNDWDTYVAEMQSKGIDKLLKLYNDNM